MKKEQHGGRHTRLYNIWLNMKQRCSNPKASHYERYGGRGITVCQTWQRSFSKFREWALTNGYAEDLTLDRMDFNAGYCPENCQWISHQEQMQNTSRNHYLTLNGETHSMAEWSRITGIPYGTIKGRINKYGWSVERALGGGMAHETRHL